MIQNTIDLFKNRIIIKVSKHNNNFTQWIIMLNFHFNLSHNSNSINNFINNNFLNSKISHNMCKSHNLHLNNLLQTWFYPSNSIMYSSNNLLINKWWIIQTSFSKWMLIHNNYGFINNMNYRNNTNKIRCKRFHKILIINKWIILIKIIKNKLLSRDLIPIMHSYYLFFQCKNRF